MGARPKITDLEKENGVLSSFSLNLDSPRFDEQFEAFFEHGRIKPDIYPYSESFRENFLTDSVNYLRGQKAEVFSDGTKIAEGTFKQNTKIMSGQSYINLKFDHNEDMVDRGMHGDEGYPLVEDLPSDIDSGEDYAEAFDIRNLTFKVVKKAKEKVKNPSPSEPDNRKEEPPKPSEPAEAANNYKGIIQLGLVAVGIAGTIGAYLWGKN
jgi:hypothetical protein